MRRVAAILILSSLSLFPFLPDNVRAEEHHGHAGTAPTAAPTPAPAAAPATPGSVSAPAMAPATSVVEVAYDKGVLTVRAEGADLTVLLKRIAEAAGIPIELADGVSGKVSIDFSRVPLEEGINRTLEAADARNFAAEFKRLGESEGVRLEKIFVATAGKDLASAQEPLPPKKKARLSNGKEIEFFKGQFLIRLGPKDLSKPFNMTLEEMIARIQSYYPLKLEKEFRDDSGRPIYLFVATQEIDELELWQRLRKDDIVTLGALYGLGTLSATLPFDAKGRFRYDPELNKKWREIDRRAEIPFEEAKRIYWQMYPYRKLGSFNGTEYPYEEGVVSISFDDIRDELVLDEYILLLCNDFNGTLYYRFHGGGDRYYRMYFPQLKGDETFQFVRMLREDPVIRANKGRIHWEGWSSKPMLRQMTYGEFQDPAADGHYAKQWSLEKIQAPQAWSIWSGPSEVEVAVVDTGIDVSAEGIPHEDFWEHLGGARTGHHIDLANARNFMLSPASGSYGAINDRKGHGTHVSGIIGAIGGNGRGIAGVAGAGGQSGKIRLLPLNIYSPDPNSIEETNKDAVRDSLEYVRTHKVDVLNLSLNVEDFGQVVEAIERIYANGTVVVIASPNPSEGLPHVTGRPKPDKEYLQKKLSDNGAFTPECTPGIESFLSKIHYVSATDRSDAPIGGDHVAGDAVTVSAPGIDIISLRSAVTEFLGNWGATSLTPPDPHYVLAKGTSMAAPHVSGLAALAMSMGGSQENAYTAIAAGADRIAAPGMGSGRINMYNTLNLIRNDQVAPGAPTDLRVSTESREVDKKTRPVNVLRWNTPTRNADGTAPPTDLYRYKIYRGLYPNFPIANRFFLCYSDVIVRPEPPTETFVDVWPNDPAKYYYRVTAVDAAGNESEASDSASTRTDYVLMIARSSRWMLGTKPADSYLRAAGLLTGALAEMMPNDSRVAVLVFQDKVYTPEARLTPVTQAGLRGFSGGDEPMEALLSGGLTVDDWRRDYWYLDISEVLLGAMETLIGALPRSTARRREFCREGPQG